MAPASPLAPCRRARREKKEAPLKLGPQRTELSQQQCSPNRAPGMSGMRLPSGDRSLVAALTCCRVLAVGPVRSGVLGHLGGAVAAGASPVALAPRPDAPAAERRGRSVDDMRRWPGSR